MVNQVGCRETRKREIKETLALATLEAEKEIELSRIATQGKPSCPSSSDSVGRPNLPVYQDGEDIALYFVMFERVAGLIDIDLIFVTPRFRLVKITVPAILS